MAKYEKEVIEKKRSTEVEDLCQNCPQEIAKMLRYIRGLNFDQKPDYTYLHGLID